MNKVKLNGTVIQGSILKYPRTSDLILGDEGDYLPGDILDANAVSELIGEGGPVSPERIDELERKVNLKADKISVYTKQEIDAKGYLTEHQDISGKADITYVDSSLENKVDKVDGKGLSTNDFTDAYKQKLDDLEEQVQSDWGENDVQEKSYIKNRTHYEYIEDDVVTLDYSDNDIYFEKGQGQPNPHAYDYRVIVQKVGGETQDLFTMYCDLENPLEIRKNAQYSTTVTYCLYKDVKLNGYPLGYCIGSDIEYIFTLDAEYYDDCTKITFYRRDQGDYIGGNISSTCPYNEYTLSTKKYKTLDNEYLNLDKQLSSTSTNPVENKAITAEVNSLSNRIQNCYNKQQSYSKVEIDDMLDTIRNGLFVILGPEEPLPQPSAEHTGKIYMLPIEGAQENYYEEYICVPSEDEHGEPIYEWDLIGSTRIDLSDYYTKHQVDLKIDESSVQSDWDESYEFSKAYIQNRTHGKFVDWQFGCDVSDWLPDGVYLDIQIPYGTIGDGNDVLGIIKDNSRQGISDTIMAQWEMLDQYTFVPNAPVRVYNQNHPGQYLQIMQLEVVDTTKYNLTLASENGTTHVVSTDEDKDFYFNLDVDFNIFGSGWQIWHGVEYIQKLDNKYLNLDSTITETSTNPVSSNTIKTELDKKQDKTLVEQVAFTAGQSTAKSIDPNKIYECTYVNVMSFAFNSATVTNSEKCEYCIKFNVGATVPTLTLPSGIKWAEELELEASTHYVLLINYENGGYYGDWEGYKL